ALRNLDALIPLCLWGQAILAVAFLAGQAFGGLNDVMLVLVMIEFGVARFQDYALAVIIGLCISLRAGSRESAAMLAVLAGLALVILRLLLTLLFLAYLPPGVASNLPALILIVATGPSSAVALAMPNLGGIIILLLMIALREVLIRRGFHYLVENLGEVA
ncbi:MAG TPA: hypothetical protein VKQ72_16465, partial [Aggregatilineales bacterium]|nr:hypothetical protein [Aggregatilineales bacterium]